MKIFLNKKTLATLPRQLKNGLFKNGAGKLDNPHVTEGS